MRSLDSESSVLKPTTLFCACVIAVLIMMQPPTAAQPEVHTHTKAVHRYAAPELTLPKQSQLIEGEVVRIFDGDTILVRIDGKNRRYQLIGADTPEYLPKERKPKPFSIESMRFIEQLLLGEQVYVQHDPAGDRDSSGLLRAYVFRAPDMLFVNLELIRQGYAKFSTRHGTLYQDSFSFYEHDAKNKSRGIWDTNPRFTAELPVEDIDEPTQQNNPVRTAEPEQTARPETDTSRSTTGLTNQIYITRSGSKYHRKDCSHLTATRQRTTRNAVEDTHTPCKTCKPDDPDSSG
tara:strand:- start:164811 stop:165683 length:873 start_codon:yes stop_codon:yes gene_type:complete